jgi:hypothetical protein
MRPYFHDHQRIVRHVPARLRLIHHDQSSNGIRPMHRRSLLLSVFPVAVLGCLSLEASAATPLDSIPATADVVLRMRHPKETIDKATEMAATVRSSLGDQMQRYADGLGLFISNPTMAGVDRSRDWHVVAFAHSDKDPSVVFIIPATDTDVLQAALPDGMASFVRDDWVFYCEEEAGLDTLRQGLPESGAGILSEMSEKSRPLFTDSDISAFVNVDHLTGIYSKQIGSHQTQIENLIKRRLGMLALVPGVDPDKMVGEGSDAAGQSVDDCTAFTAGVVINNDGVNIETYAEFTDGSATSKALSGMSTAEMNSLTDLPADSLLYFGVAGGLARKADWGLSTSSSAIEPDAEKRERLDELEESLEKVNYDSMVGALGIGDAETGYIRFVGITNASPAADLRTMKQEVTELLAGEDRQQGLTQSAEYETDAESYGDHQADLLTVTQKIDPNVNPFFAQIVGKLQETLYGPDGLQVRFLFDGDRYLQSTGGGQTAMEKAVAQFSSDSGNGLDSSLTGLISKPSIVLLLDVQRVVRMALTAAAQNPNLNLPIDPSMFGGANPEPSYVGVSLASEPNALRSKTQVPPVQLVRMVQVGLFLQMLQQK